jgi:hypothetical protein
MSVWPDWVHWGVIEDARRRQRRRRIAGVAAIVACGLAAVLALGSPGARRHAPPPLRLSSSLTWLNGSPLGRTRLRLVATEGDDPPSIIDVDSGRVTPLPQLDVPGPPNLGPYLSLTPLRGSALAVVNHQACNHCALTEDDFLISASGTVHLLASRHFPAFAGTTERSPIPGSTAEWVLRWPRRGPCTLRLIPSARPAVKVPCGNLGGMYENDIVLGTSNAPPVLVDPRTGAVRGHLTMTQRSEPVGHGLAIDGPNIVGSGGGLSLVNQATGKRRKLGWPSKLHFSYQLYLDPAGPYVAIEFGDPAYPGYSVHVDPDPQTIGQAADLWLLDTRTATLTHVPGFPILESLKQSGVAWTPDGRLVIAARGGSFAQSDARTVIGVWRPGQPTVSVGTLPRLSGYTQLVPLSTRG